MHTSQTMQHIGRLVRRKMHIEPHLLLLVYNIENLCLDPEISFDPKLVLWFNEIDDTQNEEFSSLKNAFYKHYEGILNFFNNRSTNAAAELFNAKVKDFRRAYRGVTDLSFFMFRLSKIYA